jgi:hypothetical protein
MQMESLGDASYMSGEMIGIGMIRISAWKM